MRCLYNYPNNYPPPRKDQGLGRGGQGRTLRQGPGTRFKACKARQRKATPSKAKPTFPGSNPGVGLALCLGTLRLQAQRQRQRQHQPRHVHVRNALTTRCEINLKCVIVRAAPFNVVMPCRQKRFEIMIINIEGGGARKSTPCRNDMAVFQINIAGC